MSRRSSILELFDPLVIRPVLRDVTNVLPQTRACRPHTSAAAAIPYQFCRASNPSPSSASSKKLYPLFDIAEEIVASGENLIDLTESAGGVCLSDCQPPTATESDEYYGLSSHPVGFQSNESTAPEDTLTVVDSLRQLQLIEYDPVNDSPWQAGPQENSVELLCPAGSNTSCDLLREGSSFLDDLLEHDDLIDLLASVNQKPQEDEIGHLRTPPLIPTTPLLLESCCLSDAATKKSEEGLVCFQEPFGHTSLTVLSNDYPAATVASLTKMQLTAEPTCLISNVIDAHPPQEQNLNFGGSNQLALSTPSRAASSNNHVREHQTVHPRVGHVAANELTVAGLQQRSKEKHTACPGETETDTRKYLFTPNVQYMDNPRALPTLDSRALRCPSGLSATAMPSVIMASTGSHPKLKVRRSRLPAPVARSGNSMFSV